MSDTTKYSAYLEKFLQLKEKKLVKEVMEREMLLEFIKINMEGIDEFPLLESEQEGVIDLLTKRAIGHPCHETIQEWVGDFLQSLNVYGVAQATKDEDGIKNCEVRINNLEAVLIHCVQGMVYAVGLIKDNFSHGLIKCFGSQALEKINQITEEVVYDDRYWRACFEHFYIDGVAVAYRNLVNVKDYEILKQDTGLVVRFQFDRVLDMLGATDTEIKLTRIQTAYEESGKSEEKKGLVEFLVKAVQSVQGPMRDKPMSGTDALHVAKLMSQDSQGEEFFETQTAPPPEQKEPEKVTKENIKDLDGKSDYEVQKDFVKEQAMALATGALLGTDITRDDFFRALRELPTHELNALKEVGGCFELSRVMRLVHQLAESSFVHLLQEKGQEEGSKVFVRSTRLRRVPKDAVKKLYELGLNKIREKKFWEEDAGRSDMLLFIPKSPQEMQKLMEVFQLQAALQSAIIRLWAAAGFRVDIAIVINLANVAKVTKNVPQRVGEILARYNIKP